MITQEIYDTCLFLARCVYFDVDYPEPFNKIITIKESSGLKMNIFKFDDYAIVVFAGTNQKRDWISNIGIGLGIIPKQLEQALSYTRLYVGFKTPLFVCGQSLGGAIAQYVGSQCQCSCITFNSCGCKHLIRNINANFECINIITEHDILNNIQLKLPGKKWMKHCGQMYFVTDNCDKPCAESHSDFSSMTKFKVKN